MDFFKKKQTTTSNTSFDKLTQGKQTDLSPELLAQLKALFGSATGGGGMEEAEAAQRERMRQIQDFDAQGFADAITDQAKAFAGLDLESGLNAMASKVGGSANSNSMVALLGNKLRNTTAANLSGISSSARMQGEQFKTEGIGAMSSGISKQILELIGATRGAETQGALDEKGKQSGTSKTESPFNIGDFFDILGKFIKPTPTQ